MLKAYIRKEIEKEVARMMRQSLVDVRIMGEEIEKQDAKQKEHIARMDAWCDALDAEIKSFKNRHDTWAKEADATSASNSDYIRQHANQVEQYLKGFNLLLEKLR